MHAQFFLLLLFFLILFLFFLISSFFPPLMSPLLPFSAVALFYLWFLLHPFLPCFVLCPFKTSSCPSSMMNLFASPLIHSFNSLFSFSLLFYLDLLSPLFYFSFSPVDFSLLLSLSLSQWQTIWPQPGIFNGFITDCRMLLNWEQWLAETPGRSLTPRI